MFLKVTDSFEAAHCLDMVFEKDHPCSNVHGHRWEVLVTIDTTDGFVDYNQIKHQLHKLTNRLDHTNLNKMFSVPVSEQVVSWIAAHLRSDFQIVEIELWETAHNCAIFSEASHPQKAIHKLQSANLCTEDIRRLLFDREIYMYSKNGYRKSGNIEIHKIIDLYEIYFPGTFEKLGSLPWQSVIVAVKKGPENIGNFTCEQRTNLVYKAVGKVYEVQKN